MDIEIGYAWLSLRHAKRISIYPVKTKTAFAQPPDSLRRTKKGFLFTDVQFEESKRSTLQLKFSNNKELISLHGNLIEFVNLNHAE